MVYDITMFLKQNLAKVVESKKEIGGNRAFLLLLKIISEQCIVTTMQKYLCIRKHHLKCFPLEIDHGEVNQTLTKKLEYPISSSLASN